MSEDIYLKIVTYFLVYLVLSFILLNILTFYKKRESPLVIRTKSKDVIEEDEPEFSSISASKKRYIENISEWVVPKEFLGSFWITVIVIIIMER